MAKEILKQGNSLFEQIRKIDENGNEFWFARQLAKVLDYTDFRNFIGVINKAKEACIISGQDVSDHSVEVNEMVSEFITAGILKEMTGQSRNRIFVFSAYIKLF
jgi:DNA-damage-inducible protein D